MPQTSLDTAAIRKDFPMLSPAEGRPFAYLDSASSSQTPVQVLDAMERYYRDMRANVHRGMYKASAQATETYEGVRRKVADLIRADAQEVIFTHGATESLNMVAHGLGATLGEGDEIALTVMEHHANLIPWQRVAKARGAKLTFIPLTPDYRLDMNEARKLITPKTKIVAVTMVSNVTGTIVPITEIAALAHVQGALVVVDAAQAVGHMPIDVHKLSCDLLAFSVHKMLGPTGTGVLWGKREILEKMEPFMVGGDMVRDVFRERATWNDVPWKFEAGTPNIAGVIGLGAAIDYLGRLDIRAIAARESTLAAYAIDRLSAIPGVEIIGPGADTERGSAVSFDVAGIHPHDVATILDAEGVAVRGGHHCAIPLLRGLGRPNGTVRASIMFYNTEEDIDRLIAGVEKAKRIFRIP